MKLHQEQLDRILESLPDPSNWHSDFYEVPIGPTGKEYAEMMSGEFPDKVFTPKVLRFVRKEGNGFMRTPYWQQDVEQPTAKMETANGNVVFFVPSTLPTE